ncbi:MAG: 2-C-methyl-D-erythritol 4-phosphate cytidylyltransferase [Elusimicrobiota bacterium]|nr:2-C-methyl-D-erythritol 4-phosphate cytidylyltransferase [Elusimicrobiota bacterium]
MQGSADAVIVAAGSGVRYGRRKQFLEIDGTTVINYIIRIFARADEISNVIVVYPQDMSEGEFRTRAGIDKEIMAVPGGSRRAQSVKNGLKKVSSKYVLVHDGVRPAVSQELIKRVIDATRKYGAAVPALNPSSTVKYKEGGRIKNLNREEVYLIQTPQGFAAEELIRAYECCGDPEFTDSSSVMEEAGKKNRFIKGEKYNIKITSPDDYRYIKEIIKR